MINSKYFVSITKKELKISKESNKKQKKKNPHIIFFYYKFKLKFKIYVDTNLSLCYTKKEISAFF